MRDEIKNYWTNAWDHIQSVDQVYMGYGFKSVLWVFNNLLKNEKRESILDVGCGCGLYFQHFKRLGFNDMWGLEYDKNNIEKAYFLNQHIPSLNLKQGDIKRLPEPFREEQFDVVVCLGLVEHFTYPIENIKNLLKITRKNGVLLIEMPNFRNVFYYLKSLKRKAEMPFHLWWGVKEWNRVLSRVNGATLERVQTGHLWSRATYLPRILRKVHPKLVDVEIEIENRVFRRSGSLAFYKLRKL